MPIDPEVQHLLDDLPPVSLPRALTDEGWGVQSMRNPLLGRRVKPSPTQQPKFTEHCAGCARPITLNEHLTWLDHAGQRNCPGDLLDRDRRYPVKLMRHCPQRELELLEPTHRLQDQLSQLLYGPRSSTVSECQARHRHHASGHTCACFHEHDHFGFHQCVDCRRLWR